MLPMENTLLDLFARLSRASARSRLLALRADKDHRPGLAKLFLAMAESQAMQARRFLMQIRGAIGDTAENEQGVFSHELPAMIKEYRELAIQAEKEQSRALATAFRHSAEVDRSLLELHAALGDIRQETDMYVCDFCGYVAADAPPDNCPVCTAPKNRFLKVESG